jgi:predicted ribosome quality control (RQC) complex YloA/Tae2 family protein
LKAVEEGGAFPLNPSIRSKAHPMSIRWDPILATAFARELDERLKGHRVKALHMDRDSRRVHLFLREATLVLELHPTAGWVTLLDPAEPFDDARPLPARVAGVRAPEDESAFSLELPRIRGRDEGLELVLEWISNRWNAVAVGLRSRVIRHVLQPRDERDRRLQVGATYEPPPPTRRQGQRGTLDQSEWERLVESVDEGERRAALLHSVAWSSSLTAELLREGGRDAWCRIVDPEGWAPRLVRTSRGPQPYPVSLPPAPEEPAPSLAAAMARAREEDTGEPLRVLLLPPGLLERARKRRDAARGRARGMRRELEGARDPEPIRALGDLILARYGEVPQGVDRAVLTGFEGTPVEVELDPEMSPAENAERYYDEAARVERARTELPRRIEAAQTEAEEWEALTEGLVQGTVPVDEVRRRLGPERRAPGRKGARDGPSLPYRTFKSSGGLEIRVGRGAARNDELTFHHSRPDDIWLHVRQAPGAHVILRWQGSDKPPKRDLVEAAVLTALHSEARHSGSVPVDWTRRKYVRKPRKAPPGAVLPDRVETLFVRPDPDLPKRLQEDR